MTRGSVVRGAARRTTAIRLASPAEIGRSVCAGREGRRTSSNCWRRTQKSAASLDRSMESPRALAWPSSDTGCGPSASTPIRRWWAAPSAWTARSTWSSARPHAGRCGKKATDAPRRSWATAAGPPLVGASHNRLWSRLEGLCRRIAVTWKDKLEIGLKEDAPYRKDNLPASEIRGPEKPAGPGRSPEIPMARAHKTPPSTQARTRTTARKPGPTSPEPSARARRKPRTA
jgi:hypothetical protein